MCLIIYSGLQGRLCDGLLLLLDDHVLLDDHARTIKIKT